MCLDETVPNGGVTKYRYDKMGQLTAEISPLGSKTGYTYNAAGLLTESRNARKQNTAYAYDKAGRITSMTDELGTTEYTYDAENNRIAMESDRHKETYVVDTVSSSLSRILTITEGGATTDAGTNADGGKTNAGTTTLCIYGQGLICEKTGDIYRYHHYNNLGSTGFTRFLYNGRCGVITDDNGFYYMRRRYYSPELKRFVNQDVIRGSLDNSQSLNRYSYVQGNPVSYTDHFGLSPLNGLFTGTTLWHGVLGLLGHFCN